MIQPFALVILSYLTSISSQSFTENTPRILFEIARPYLRIDRLQISKHEKCIPPLGCFKNDGLFYHPVYRSLSLVPEDRHKIDTVFTLYTRRNPQKPQNISADIQVIKKTFFNPKIPTIIVIHGFYFDNFFGKYQLGAFSSLREALFSVQDINMIFTDWGRGASTWYLQATANARVVGAEIALLANTLINHFKMSGKDFHIIGHSLGSHIAGYAGERIKGLGRITGLDPAKPYFDNMPLAAKLDPTDALFVDIIHTNAPMLAHPFGFGTRELSGDIDYYPNDGNGQPGCFREKMEAFIGIGFANGLRKSGVCNHARSILFLTETLSNKKCKMFAYKCPSYELFENGQCWRCGEKRDSCRIMGDYYPTNGLKLANLEGYYLMTHSEPPFCAFQFRVELFIRETPRALGNQLVSFSAEISDGVNSANGNSRRLIVKAGQTVSFIIMGSAEILTLKKVSLTWIRLRDLVSSRLHPETHQQHFNETMSVDYVKVTPLNLWEDHIKDKLTTVACNFAIFNNLPSFLNLKSFC